MQTFLIVKVQRNEGDFLVSKLLVRPMRPGAKPEWISRALVLDRIKRGLASFYTLPPDGHGSDKFGPKARLVDIDGSRYLRVDGAREPEDDLGSIPTEPAG